jgi:NAD(P)H-hydrate epimerase
MLIGAGREVEVIILEPTGSPSADFNKNLERINGMDPSQVSVWSEGMPLPEINPGCLIVDAIFGSGLTRPVVGDVARMIRHINESGAVVISIDMPSGLFADKYTEEKDGAVVKADYTLSFEFPKLAFMFSCGDQYVGEWHLLPIDLHQDFIQEATTRDHLLTEADIQGLLRPRKKFSHKGNYGHALLIAGSKGKMGAAVLAARGCLRSGTGLLHVHVPAEGHLVIQTALPEAMLSIDPDPDFFTSLPDLGPYQAVGIGPGIGFGEKTRAALKMLIQNSRFPLLFDADAITILGENKTWVPFIPRGSVITPHPKEFERIAGPTANDFDRHERQREFAVKYGLYVVLKGAHTAICFPDGNCYFNPTGNPGMATGGSGDVLTGMILGLMAQGYQSGTACLIGVYLHGLAGDLAAARQSMQALTAGDIAGCIGAAFRKIQV